MDLKASTMPSDDTPPPREAKLREEGGPERIQVADLVKGAREVVLVHDGQEYRLRVTAKGKLILTK